MNLWEHDISFDKRILAIAEINEEIENSIMETAKHFAFEQKNGTSIKKTETTLIVNQWAIDNIKYLKTVIDNTSSLVEPILKTYGFDLHPNWDVINQPAYEIHNAIDNYYSNAMGDAFSDSSDEFMQVYNDAYNSSLANSKGLGFGIISSSLTAHLLYAAQAAYNETKNEMNAIKAASQAISDDPLAMLATLLVQKLTPLYNDYIEPKMFETLSNYYSLVIEYICEGLNISYNEYCRLIDKEKSDSFITEITPDSSPQEAIINALTFNPNNGKVIILVAKHNLIDNAFINYCKNSSSALLKNIAKEAKSILHNNLNYISAFSKPLYNDRNSEFINCLRALFSSLPESKSIYWNEIITDIYSCYLQESELEFNSLKALYDAHHLKEELKKVSSENILQTTKQMFDGAKMINYFSLANDFCYEPAKSALLEFNCISTENISKKITELESLIKEVEPIARREQKEELARIEQMNKEREELVAKYNSKLNELKSLQFSFWKSKEKALLRAEISSLNEQIKQLK